MSTTQPGFTHAKPEQEVTMTAQNISFAVSTEELLVILGYLKAESMPGVDGSRLQGLGEEQLGWALGIAERALYARGFIIPDPQKKPALAPTVFSVVGACVMPEITIVVSCNRPNQRREEYYYHLSRAMAVMHYSLNEGIHQLWLFRNARRSPNPFFRR